ncbi:MAG: hypothetical protein CVT61_15990 [Actinobacteria bacterium HGW-Actinobacteria-11]|nr:MAG: hypothetical protein CVT61_15990 [Actinobacteria bacterium HGW-Actinobacteria-11]
MTTWILLGGPQHGTTGEGDEAVPVGYAFEGVGRSYSPVYPDGTKEADGVYRWSVDTAYIRDGQQIIENVRRGVYEVAAENVEFAQLGIGMAMGSVQFGLSNISVEPLSEHADRVREVIDAYRNNHLV